MRCHPARWLWGLIPIAMLSWLAVHVESDPIERDLEQRSGAALAAAGYDWASVAFSGREGLLVGRPANERQRDEAAALVRSLWGVRTLETRVATTSIADLPIATVAKQIGAPQHTLSDVPPALAAEADTVNVPIGVTIALAPFEQAPAVTVRAREPVEPAKPVVAAVPASVPLPVHKPVQMLVPTAVSAPPDAGDSPPKAVAASVPLPIQKPVQMLVPPAVPASPDAGDTPPKAVAASVPLPIQKPVQGLVPPAAPAPPDAGDTPPKAVADAPIPPLPVPAPRFETAALPQSNIGSDIECVSAARVAAQAVEVHFARGRAMLDTSGKALLDRLVAAVNSCPQAALQVAGHSDAAGRAPRNLALSRRRARTVAAYMIHKGIDAGRLVAVGYGETRPVAPNDTRANRAKNRRIEVAITGSVAPLPPMPVHKKGTDNGLSHR
jgi:outer membrane protein OmpA-like peptidoglycan-associated protein